MANINTMQESLLVKILEWVKCQPVSIRNVFTLKIVQVMPCCDLSYGKGDLLVDFSDWILVQASDEKKSYGAALSLKSIIDFLIEDMHLEADNYYQRVGAVDGAIERLSASPNSEIEISSLREYKKKLLDFPVVANQISDAWAIFCSTHCSTHAAHLELWPGGVFWLRLNCG